MPTTAPLHGLLLDPEGYTCVASLAHATIELALQRHIRVSHEHIEDIDLGTHNGQRLTAHARGPRGPRDVANPTAGRLITHTAPTPPDHAIHGTMVITATDETGATVSLHTDTEDLLLKFVAAQRGGPRRMDPWPAIFPVETTAAHGRPPGHGLGR